MAARRSLFVLLLAVALVVPLAGPATAHEAPAPAPGAAIAEPSTEGAGEAMEPVANLQYALTEGVTANNGSDIEFYKLGAKEYALAGTLRNGLQIVDITNPATPTVVGVYDCPITQGDVQVFRQGERVLATYTADAAIAPTDNSGNRTEINQARFEAQCSVEAQDLLNAEGEDEFDGRELGTFIVDITDPTAPKTVSFIEVPEGSHNQTVHPSGDYLYNSNSDLLGLGGLPEVTIHNISNPEKPELVQNFSFAPVPTSLGTESHDIFFNGDGTRAYVAALSSTIILDTSNPEEPEEVSRIVDPAIQVVHQADFVTLPRLDGSARDLLIIDDERAGAAASAECPGGGVHVYDVTGELEQDPQKLGTWFIDVIGPRGGEVCTSHVFRIYPDQKLITMAWYSEGARVLDISGLAELPAPTDGAEPPVAFGEGVGIKEIGSYVFDDADTWSFKTNRIEADASFYGYGNDLARGLDVYRFEGGESGLSVPPLEPEDMAAEGLCAGVPVATAYVDRTEARDTHERSIDCVIYRAMARGISKEMQWFYEPLNEVTREQMASFTVSAMRAAGVDAEFPAPPAEDKFDDIAESAHRANINLLAEAGIITGTGDGKFSPTATISRQQMATFIVKATEFALGQPLAPGAPTFDDVSEANPHAETISSGSFAGLFSGTSNTTFTPGANVQRDQMATFLTNLLDTAGDSQSAQPGRQ